MYLFTCLCHEWIDPFVRSVKGEHFCSSPLSRNTKNLTGVSQSETVPATDPLSALEYHILEVTTVSSPSVECTPEVTETVEVTDIVSEILEQEQQVHEAKISTDHEEILQESIIEVA